MTNREYLLSCIKTKSYENDFIRFITSVQLDSCNNGEKIFPQNSQEWKAWLADEAIDTISNVEKIMGNLGG